GNIEFLGRLDHQVKIRGIRIELGEIESVLNRYGPVQHSVVIAHEDSLDSSNNKHPGNKRLIAYVTSGDDIDNEDIDITALKSYLKQQLPGYMVPKVIIPLENFPLTPNGKIDRRALPIPTGELARTGGITPPQTEHQIALITLFAETLGLPIEYVGIHDSFFELGGHSLSATHLTARLREEFKVEVPLRIIFESPTVEELDHVLTHDLTSDLLVPAIKPMDRDGAPIALSYAQERLWFLSQLENTSASYNIPTAIHITGPIDPNSLQLALDALVDRHEILRTTFPLVEGNAIQKIAPILSIPVQVIEASTLENPRDWLNQQAQQPFNVMTGPLMRVILMRLGENETILAVTMHHIISDGWSLGILIHELAAFYKAHRDRESVSLLPLPIQYADYALWQRKWQHESAIQQQLAYWQQQLSDAPALLQLPTDHPRPARATFQGQQQRLTLNTALSQQLRCLSQQSGTTLFMTLLTAFAILLSRLSGQEDILIGSPIVNRNQLELESLIGFFVNTLVLRIDLSGKPNVSDLLQQVRQTTLDAYTHQDITFEKLVAELQPERHLDRNPLFQVFFNMVNLPRQGLEIPGLTLTPVPVTNLPTKFDLTLYVEETPVDEHQQTIQLDLLYSVELFEADRVAEMLAQFQHLLEQIVHAPDRSIAELSLVTPQSRQLLPHSTVPLPEPTYDPVTVHFNRIAREIPENTAISQGTHSWTYGELSSCAARIRQTLHHHQIKSNDVVAVTGIRSFGFIAAVLGVLQRGAVLLTIDPALPTARQHQMLSEAQAKCLLHCHQDRSEDLGKDLDLDLDIKYIQIEPDTGKPVGQGTASDCQVEIALDVETILPDQAAYIFFTSGTTGTPKGILGSHKGLSHFLHWQRQTFAVKRSDRIAQLTGLSFDVLLRDIFLPLTSGATLCLPDSWMNPGEPEMMDWLGQQQVTLLHTVPTLAQAWLTTLSESFVAGPLRGVFFAGEPLSDQLVHHWRRVFPTCQDIVNLYGPTETTLAKSYYRIPAEPVPGIQPIGQPLPETQLWVLNSQGQFSGIGETGEIAIRTPFRTLGYINASQGERHRFRLNPFSNDPNDIIYYTGDFGRYQPNGTLDILGRRDHQVKIRGVRIELGEIENALAGHSDIHHAIATVFENLPGNQYLAAYVVPHSAQIVQTESLRQYLKQRLPDYMLPSVFVVLDQLPLTTNGKVNRKALPPPPELRDTPDSLVAPQTETQLLIAACFATVLSLPIEQIGLYDSFFTLGGHSLLAMQLMMRLRDTFDVELPLQKVFESPTVAALEAVLTSDFAPGLTIPAIIPIEQDGTSIPLSYAQERLWFLAQLEGLSATYNLPVAVQIKGSLDINALEQALGDLVTRHEVLRTTFPIVNGTAVQKIAPTLQIPLQIIAASNLASDPSDWFIQETQRPFDLEQGPLLRVKLLHLSEDTSVLAVIMHHIISDGWSVGVFIRELTTLYEAYRQGQDCPWPSLPIQYVD
ncbi:MAG: amino acid adenylation domain-containing protein, partial [Cyanobacteria bacterium P01_F01_bin.116]